MSGNQSRPSCLCGGSGWDKIFTYDRPPQGENLFGFSKERSYFREVFRCQNCGHFISEHGMDESALYSGEYVNSAYGDEQGILRAFSRINALEDPRSDNAGRVRRICEFAGRFFPPERLKDRKPSILDVGSGLCVFLHRMKKEGWECTALDPDPRAIEHARKNAGVSGICADFTTAKDLGSYDVISFNKVLEHIKDPVPVLARSAEFLKPGGFVYVELPDGEAAVAEGPGREEFFIEHHHIFSMSSFALLIAKSGFAALFIESFREPSGKFTLRGCLTLKAK